MYKPILTILFSILFTSALYGYTITVKEKLVGLLNKTTVIRNITFIEIDNNYVHIEIKEKDKVNFYSFPCDDVIRITEDYGENIPFNCDNAKHETSIQMGNSEVEKEEKRESSELKQDNRSDKNAQIQDLMIREGYFQRMSLTKHNIKVEGDVVTIKISCRRTNIQSTLIKSYWLCGYAMDKNNLFYSEIRVILNIQKRGISSLVTVANGKDVIELGQQKLPGLTSFNNFLNKLEVYRKNTNK